MGITKNAFFSNPFKASIHQKIFQLIAVRATRREIVVMLSANELSMGITKLSESQPLR
jgi:hypothetical protein